MTLRDDAIAAYQAAQNGREGEARQVLATTLMPEDVSGLVVADVTVAAGFTRYVFTDSDLYLAVVLRDAGDSVHLVSGSPGEWTDLATITSLAGLGKVLPGLVPPPPPTSGPAAWAYPVAYQVGDEVTYDGKTYRCRQAHTSLKTWAPPNVPALWEVVVS